MARNSVQWNLSPEKCFEIIHLTLIDILNEKKDKVLSLNKLVENLNSRTKVYKLHNQRRYNTFSKYLKVEYDGILNFIEDYNFYGVIRSDNDIQVKLYKNLVEFNDINYSAKRVTKDSDWILLETECY